MWRRLGLLQSRQIDVVFSDVVLPGGRSGVDLANVLKAYRPSVPVLLTSGFYKPETEMPIGLTVIQKPYTLANVEQHIRRLLQGPDR